MLIALRGKTQKPRNDANIVKSKCDLIHHCANSSYSPSPTVIVSVTCSYYRRGFVMGLFDDAKKAAKDAGDKVAEAASDVKDAVSEKFSEATDKASDKASDKLDEAKASGKAAGAEAEKAATEAKNAAKDKLR